jgi:tetratricopeptide (TPR) repeat protein
VDESAKQSGKKVELAWSLMLRGHLEQALGFNPRAAATLDEAIGLFFQEGLPLSGEDERHNASALALCYLNKAALSRAEGKIDDALAFCDMAAEQHRISEDRLDAARRLSSAARSIARRPNGKKALRAFSKRCRCSSKSQIRYG